MELLNIMFMFNDFADVKLDQVLHYAFGIAIIRANCVRVGD